MEKENKKLKLEDRGIWLKSDIEDVLQQIYDHYRNVTQTNEYLMEENNRLKSEAYKDEEISKMKQKYEKMKDDYYRGFPISDEEDNKIIDWMDKQIEKFSSPTGAIGGRFYYKFYPTSIGTTGVVVDSLTGEHFTFKELS